MADFESQIEGLTSLSIESSSSSPTQAEVTQYLTDGAREIVHMLPPDLKRKCTTISILNNSSPTLSLDGAAGTGTTTQVGNIIEVTRKSASDGYYTPCRKIPSRFGDLTNDSTSIHYAIATDPVYWITSNSSDATTLFVKPTPTSSELANVYHISYPIVAYTHTSIPNFPDEAEHLVVLFAAAKSLLNAIGSVSVPPGAAGETDLTTMTALGDSQAGTDAEFIDFSDWFAALGEMIEDDEDLELATAQIQKIQTYINTYNIQLQGGMQQIAKYMQMFQVIKADYAAGIQAIRAGAGLSVPRR